MIKSSIEKVAKDIGFDIAMSDDKVQQDLLNGLGEGFGKLIEHDFNNQLCYISRGLSKEAIKFIKTLNEYISE